MIGAAALAAALILSGCGDAVYLADHIAANQKLDAADRHDLRTGNLAAIEIRYANADLANLSIPKLALYCEVVFRGQELGLAQHCLNVLQRRIAKSTNALGPPIARAVPGRRALLDLAFGKPQLAIALMKSDFSLGGRYVYALASIRSGNAQAAKPIAKRLSRYYKPSAVYYATSLYEALGDYQKAWKLLHDPARRLLVDYGLGNHKDVFGGTVRPGVFRLDIFNEFDFGLLGRASLAPAGNVYVEYLAALADLRTGRMEDAKRRLKILLHWPYISGFRDVYWRALSDQATLAEHDGNFGAAERLLRRAISVIEEIRGSVDTEGARIAVVADKQAPYRSLVDILVRRHQYREAVSYIERADNQTLVEILAERYRFGPSGSIADRLLTAYDRAAGSVILSGISFPADLEKNRAILLRAKSALKRGAPAVADLVMVTPPDVGTVQRSLNKDEAALIYFPGAIDWHVFTVTRNSIRAYNVPAAAITANVVALRLALAHGGDWMSADKSLYRAAVLPAVQSIKASSLIVVPSGVLFYAPFAALGDGSSDLVDHYSLRIVPNLGLITRRPKATKGSHALVIGDSLRGSPKYNLPYAEREARAVAAFFPGSKLLMGRQATISAFRRLAPTATLIHFAGHGVFDAKHPLESGLVFAGPRSQPEVLQAQSLYDMHTDASLAFLSACDTGVVAVRGGEDIMGLERGFFFAGVRTIVASLWPVQDRATAMLAEAFYRAWNTGAGVSPARALQKAQLAVRRLYPNPEAWASFEVATVGGG